MRHLKIISFLFLVLILAACGKKEKKIPDALRRLTKQEIPAPIPIDKGFSQYVTGYTSGIVSSASPIEIRFTPEFATLADKSAGGIFSFDPYIKGKSEWKNETTLVFTPSGLLDPGIVYTGTLNMGKLADLEERYRSFPIRIQVMRKDFRLITGTLECDTENEKNYILHGEIALSDVMADEEVEKLISAKLERRKLPLVWDHSEKLIRRFIVKEITRASGNGTLSLEWDGTHAGINQEGVKKIIIPPSDKFSVLDVIKYPGQNPRIEVVFSDPPDENQELDGLIYFTPQKDLRISTNSNIVSLFPGNDLSGELTLNIEASVRNKNKITLAENYSTDLNFSQVLPGIMLEGKGAILPASRNLILPFKAANLKAVDIRIIRIFENNLPYFLQENDIDQGYSVKRFGRPVYSGRYDLISGSEANTGSWNHYTINLADFIDVEPGVLYKVVLSMRKSYSLYPCQDAKESGNYEEMLEFAEQNSRDAWDDPDNYYDDVTDELYYSYGFRWEDRDDPCKDAYFSPDKKVSRNIIASNFGMIAKMGPDRQLHVTVNDLISALPVNEASIDVFDYQLQLIASGKTNPEGSTVIKCDRKPFLIIARKDKDRNYLKVNDGASLSLSSFDITGTTPVNGIKAFVYGERDVWRPGDSIFLSLMIRDMQKDLPKGHPVQFELINPFGQKIDNQVQMAGNRNLLVFASSTPQDAITGNYTANFRIGGALFTKRVRIETVKPNRLKIDLDFGEEILGGSSSIARGSLTSGWLNGATAGNMKASVEYLLKKSKTEFSSYRQYDFDDPVNEFYAETVSIFNNETDAGGKASIVFNPSGKISAPGMLNAVFTVKVSEPGGDESIIQKTYKYAPFPVFAGINLPGLQRKSRMLFTDADNEVKIVTVDENGKPVNTTAEVNIYKISYRWWWESNEEELVYYISNKIYKPVFSKNLPTKNGEASCSFNIPKNEWGRYLVRVSTPEGHSTGKILLVDWPWEYGSKAGAEGATLLALSTDREKYAPGDEIKLSFPSPENASAIISLENATGVLSEIRVNTEKGNTEVKIPVKPEMAPNVYAYVTVVQPHAQTVNDMPARLYGVIPVIVEDPATRLNPEIEISDELRSQKPFTVKVGEKGNKAMNYTLAIVDEGLLDITGFRTPDPWKYFYSREALGVMTWDMYDLVLGSYGGTLDRLFAVGGDEAVIDKAAGKARRFIPVVRFFGPYKLDAGKTNTHAITLPQYTGSVKTMVIAGNESAFGFAEKSSFVRDPLMILGTAPRSVSPGDKVDIPVSLFVQGDKIKEVTITGESNDLVSFTEKKRSIVVSGNETDTGLSFLAGSKTGTAIITLRAEGGGETATYTFELEVRNPDPPQVYSELKILRPGEKWDKSYKISGALSASSANISVSSLPSIDLGRKMDYLINYPHGCSEQIVSAAFPQLWIAKISGSDDNLLKKASFNVAKAIDEAYSRQMVNGGVALWPGANQPDNWVTSYTGHFMAEAERFGYSIPPGFMQKWMAYQKSQARDWKFDTKFRQTANDQAYRLFTLALAGQPDKPSMNRLRETPGLPRLSKWLLAAAYITTGRKEAADELLDMRDISTEPEYSTYYYGSETRDKAIILYTLTLLDKNEEALRLASEICNSFSNESWFSTQSAAWGLFSYMKWAEKMQASGESASEVNLSFNGEGRTLKVNRGKIHSLDLKTEKNDNTLLIENRSGSPVYATLTLRNALPAGPEAKSEKGLAMKIEYLNRNLAVIDPSQLKQGTDFMMVARITNNTFTRVENIALTAMIPSGWEISNTRLYETVTGIKESSCDYRDFRDDRVNTYFPLAPGETRTFYIRLNAAYRGEYKQPAISCEAMYNASVYSRIPGNTVKVTEGY